MQFFTTLGGIGLVLLNSERIFRFVGSTHDGLVNSSPTPPTLRAAH